MAQIPKDLQAKLAPEPTNSIAKPIGDMSAGSDEFGFPTQENLSRINTVQAVKADKPVSNPNFNLPQWDYKGNPVKGLGNAQFSTPKGTYYGMPYNDKAGTPDYAVNTNPSKLQAPQVQKPKQGGGGGPTDTTKKDSAISYTDAIPRGPVQFAQPGIDNITNIIQSLNAGAAAGGGRNLQTQRQQYNQMLLDSQNEANKKYVDLSNTLTALGPQNMAAIKLSEAQNQARSAADINTFLQTLPGQKELAMIGWLRQILGDAGMQQLAMNPELVGLMSAAQAGAIK